MMTRRRYLRLGFLAFSLASFALASRAVIKEHQDIANYIYDQAKTRAALNAATAGLMTPTYIEEKVNAALAHGDMALAGSYRDIAAEHGYQLSAETEKKYQSAKKMPATVIRNTGKAAQGCFAGEGDSLAHISGAVGCDFLVIGDVRDITIQTTKYFTGQEVDEFVFTLSGIGLVLTVGTYATGGTAAPAKFGVSVIKFAKRTGRMTMRFAGFITDTTRVAVPFKTLTRNLAAVPYGQRIRRLETSGLQDDVAVAFGKSINKTELAKLEKVFDDLHAVEKTTGSTETVLRTLKLVDTPEDLAKLRRVSETAGGKTLAYADSLGKRMLDSVQSTMKISAKIIVKYAWAIASFVASMVAAIVLFGMKHIVLAPMRRLIYRNFTRP
ncbi:exported hypothetical protein [uncultured Defluviicoccus sp.]|uniref:Uncharacterized protein n=1 Tax=metagenome TaxID=256318 RepID=A0A380TG15_9ZZZZ|nr:exported hypothetical protein [uncultured Defluviicoccus sp.]